MHNFIGPIQPLFPPLVGPVQPFVQWSAMRQAQYFAALHYFPAVYHG